MKQKLVRNVVFVLLGILVILASGCTGNSGSEEVSVKESMNEGIMDESANAAQGGAGADYEAAGDYVPAIDPADFVEEIDNPYLPLKPGTTFVYEGETEDGSERNEVYVSHEKKVVMGVNTTVVEDRVWEDGELVEETFDWFAQDKDGNVWYFGEDSKEYEDGEVVSTQGSWEAGVDGAKPGIVMQASPQVGAIYYQEYYVGEAEDQAEVLSTNESVTVSYGSYENCLQTREWTDLEPDVEENKYYAPGIGFIRETVVMGGSGSLELVNITSE